MSKTRKHDFKDKKIVEERIPPKIKRPYRRKDKYAKFKVGTDSRE